MSIVKLFYRAPEPVRRDQENEAREWMRPWWPAAASSVGINSRRFIARHRDRDRADHEWLTCPWVPACELVHIRAVAKCGFDAARAPRRRPRANERKASVDGARGRTNAGERHPRSVERLSSAAPAEARGPTSANGEFCRRQVLGHLPFLAPFETCQPVRKIVRLSGRTGSHRCADKLTKLPLLGHREGSLPLELTLMHVA
jgi:hypothetical protein